jgi:hypothetical protein
VATAQPGDCLGGSDDEIGDPWTNITTGLTGYNPSVFLDFTGLAAGTTVQSVTLTSLQPGEGWLLLASSNGGATYAPFAGSTGLSAGGAQEPSFTINLPAGTNFLKISKDPAGGAGDNYLVQSVTTVSSLGNQGCTPGYWKQSQHFDSWPAAYSTGQAISTVFNVPGTYTLNGAGLGTYTLLQGLSFQGGNDLSGKAQILLRAAISAVLNSGSVQYGMSLTDIVSSVNAALASGDATQIINLATTLDNLNNGLGGCPLN